MRLYFLTTFRYSRIFLFHFLGSHRCSSCLPRHFSLPHVAEGLAGLWTLAGSGSSYRHDIRRIETMLSPMWRIHCFSFAWHRDIRHEGERAREREREASTSRESSLTSAATHFWFARPTNVDRIVGRTLWLYSKLVQIQKKRISGQLSMWKKSTKGKAECVGKRERLGVPLYVGGL